MAAKRSFTEYVKKRYDNDFWAAAESYLETNLDSLGIELIEKTKRIIRKCNDEDFDPPVE